MQAPNIKDGEQRALYFLAAATIGLYLMVVALGIFGFIYNRQRAAEGHEAHAFLCDQRESIMLRIDRTENFLNSGGKIPGVPNTLIRDGLNRDKITLKNLRQLDCE